MYFLDFVSREYFKFIFEQQIPVFPQMRNAPTHLVTLE